MIQFLLSIVAFGSGYLSFICAELNLEVVRAYLNPRQTLWIRTSRLVL